MDSTPETRWTAFAGARRILSGPPAEVAVAAKAEVSRQQPETVLVFNESGHVVDIDFRGSDVDVVARLGLEPPTGDGQSANGESLSPYRDSLTPRGRGRPKLGVVAREVTLLPRHWEWLATQPGGASAAVRRLVDDARQSRATKDRLRHAKEAAYRFMSAMAGNEEGFEEATRALFAGNQARFDEMTQTWPRDVRDHARTLAAKGFA